jgi:hypothetical protein
LPPLRDSRTRFQTLAAEKLDSSSESRITQLHERKKIEV